jgi:hypothetical protein
MPGLEITDINEDHVWNEFYLDGTWYYFQNDWSNGATRVASPGGGQDVDYGGGKDISFILGWLGDGRVESNIERYSNSITLDVTLTDANGQPVPDGVIEIYSEGWQTSEKYVGYWMVTDAQGHASAKLGDNRDFYVRALTNIGDYPIQPHKGEKVPPTLEQVIQAADAVNGATFTFEHQFDEPLVNVTVEEPENQNDSFALHVTLGATHRFQLIHNSWSGVYAFQPTDTPAIDAFLVNDDNLDAAKSNDPFTAAYAWMGVTDLDETVYPPTDETWNLLVTHHSAFASDQLLDISVTTEGDPWVPPSDDTGDDDDTDAVTCAGCGDDDDDDDNGCCGF